jgi:hypothetical protein
VPQPEGDVDQADEHRHLDQGSDDAGEGLAGGDAGRLTPARVRRAFRNIRATTTLPASAPKPSRPGPGRPPGSRNRRPALRYDVGKTVKRDLTITAPQQRAG